MAEIIGVDYASVDQNTPPNFAVAKQAGVRFAIVRAVYVVNQLRSAGILQVSEEAESMVSKLMADNLPKATSSRLLKPRTK